MIGQVDQSFRQADQSLGQVRFMASYFVSILQM